jgi:chemotaxis protein methyltransferase CheR
MTAALLPDAWNTLREFLLRNCGVGLNDDQRYLLESRLAALAKKRSYATVEAYVRAACGEAANSELRDQLVDAMTTHETSFFRDQGFWRHFCEKILPPLTASLRGRPLKIWSAACSTGQEAYTLAMALAEQAPTALRSAVIVGTDVSRPAVEQARAGFYTDAELSRGVSPERRARHFEPAPGGARVVSKLRDRVKFQTGSLLDDLPPLLECDLVLCRNVLIYFKPDGRAAAMRLVGAALRPDGQLGVGNAERIGSVPPSQTGWYAARLLQEDAG